MSAEQLIGLLLGPSGALVLALIALRYQARAAARSTAELRDRFEAEIQHLRTELDQEQREHMATAAQLREEHRARLGDARATTQTLLALTDRVHQTIDAMRALAHASAPPGPLRPPRPATSGTSRPR